MYVLTCTTPRPMMAGPALRTTSRNAAVATAAVDAYLAIELQYPRQLDGELQYAAHQRAPTGRHQEAIQRTRVR